VFAALGFALGLWEIALIILIVLLLFGTAKIPKLMRNIGAGVHEFKDGIKDGEKKNDPPAKDADPKPPA
jgi:sec-independent protein translocase protein TatA